MEIRVMTTKDLAALAEIDATVESTQYLHIDRSGEGTEISWKVQTRDLREKRVHRRPMDVEYAFSIRQVVEASEEGIALVAEHDGALAAAAAAKVNAAHQTLHMIDVRVDFDFRRQGLASAMMFQIIQEARTRELRAVHAMAAADCFPAISLLTKLGFELGGLDTFLHSNHDLVKEAVALFWYLPLG